MHNDVGSCELLASVAPSVQPGQVIVYHGWEPLSFKDWKGNQEPVPSVWKSLHMLQYMPECDRIKTCQRELIKLANVC